MYAEGRAVGKSEQCIMNTLHENIDKAAYWANQGGRELR